MEVIQNRIDQLREELGDAAGNDPLSDRFKVGAIQAYYDLIRIQFDEVEA